MNQPEFPTVFRGYDPVSVDQHVSALRQAAEAARQAAEAAQQEAASASVSLTKLRQSHDALMQEVDGQRRSVAELEEHARRASNPSFADLGERIGSILTLADEEAAAIRATAEEEAGQTRFAADEAAALARTEADRYAEDRRSRADVDAEQALARAKQEADSIVDDAAREAAARREEAEAYFEKQRATAAASAADFERTLAERREKATAEFTGQMAKQDQALAAVQERADLLAREAEQDRAAAAEEAARVLDAARSEAAALVASAKEQAERVRRDSERELSAATARRDSITAQLSNVRNMLATLGGPAAVTALDAAADADAPAEQAPAEDAEQAPAAESVDTSEATAEADGDHPASETGEVDGEQAASETAEDDATADDQGSDESDRVPGSARKAKTPRASEEVGDGVPDRVRDLELGGRTDVGDVVGAALEDVHGVVVLPEGDADPHLVDDQQVTALASQLWRVRARARRPVAVAGLGGKPHDHGGPGTAPRGSTSPARMSGLRTSSIDRGRLVVAGLPRLVGLLDLGRRVVDGRKSATAAAITIDVGVVARCVPRPPAGPGRSRRVTIRDAGGQRAVRRWTPSVTVGAAAAAACAMAYPCLPDERLPR
jgi:cell division septum initiation protein DivIVA